MQIDSKAVEDGSRRLADDVLLTELSDVFVLLYDTCLRLANRTVRDSGLAEEVVQEAFLAAWQHAPARFDPARGPLALWPSGPLALWLMTLTRHKAVDSGTATDVRPSSSRTSTSTARRTRRPRSCPTS